MAIRFVAPASPYYSPFLGGRPKNARKTQSLSNISTLVTAFLAILATGGPTYSFGVYAATLKANLELTQSQLETLGAASFAAGLISWIPGLAVDAWGPRKALVVGGAGQCVGFFLYWIVARFAYIHLPSESWIPILSSLSVLIFTSNNLVIGGVFKSLVVSCGLGTKGKAVGAGKAFLGLGAGVYSCLFNAIQQTMGLSSDLDFLAMSSVSAVTSIVLPAALGLPSPKAVETHGVWDDSTSQHYTLLYTGLFFLAMAAVGTSAAAFLFPVPDEDSPSGPQFPEWLHGILIVLLWVGPVLSLMLVPTKRKVGLPRKAPPTQSVHRLEGRAAADGTPIMTERTKLLPPQAAMSDSNYANELAELGFKESAETCETPQSVKDRNLIEMLQTVDAWLFLLSATILVGSGTMLTINMGQMVEAHGFEPSATSTCLAIFSVSQALARVTAGAISESALQWPTTIFGINGVPRTSFLVLSCALAVGGHTSLAVAGEQRSLFVIGIVSTGLSFGALWPLAVLIVGDLFGTVNHGANYMFADGFTCAVGTLSIAKYLTQSVYEAHVSPSSSECSGEECFGVTHKVVAALCLCSLVATLILCYTTRSCYGNLIR